MGPNYPRNRIELRAQKGDTDNCLKQTNNPPNNQTNKQTLACKKGLASLIFRLKQFLRLWRWLLALHAHSSIPRTESLTNAILCKIYIVGHFKKRAVHESLHQ